MLGYHTIKRSIRTKAAAPKGAAGPGPSVGKEGEELGLVEVGVPLEATGLRTGLQLGDGQGGQVLDRGRVDHEVQDHRVARALDLHGHREVRLLPGPLEGGRGEVEAGLTDGLLGRVTDRDSGASVEVPGGDVHEDLAAPLEAGGGEGDLTGRADHGRDAVDGGDRGDGDVLGSHCLCPWLVVVGPSIVPGSGRFARDGLERDGHGLVVGLDGGVDPGPELLQLLGGRVLAEVGRGGVARVADVVIETGHDCLRAWLSYHQSGASHGPAVHASGGVPRYG